MKNQQNLNYRSLITCKYTYHGLFVGALVLAVILVAMPLLAIAGGQLALETLSNRPDKLSGGDALVSVDVPPGVALDKVTVRLDGVDVTDLFTADGSGGLIGLIEGLSIGKNLLQAKAKGAGTASLQLVNHPLEGRFSQGHTSSRSSARLSHSRSTKAVKRWDRRWTKTARCRGV